MIDLNNTISGQQAITWWCAALSDLRCAIGGLYECFCNPDGKDDDIPLNKQVSKVIVDFALKAIREKAWELRKDHPELIISPELLEEYMRQDADPWDEEYS